MSALAGRLSERVTLLRPPAERDDLGGASGAWRDGMTVWAAVRPDGFADGGSDGDGAGPLSRFVVTLRTTNASVLVERLRWRGRTLAVRRVENDPKTPDQHILRVEQMR